MRVGSTGTVGTGDGEVGVTEGVDDGDADGVSELDRVAVGDGVSERVGAGAGGGGGAWWTAAAGSGRTRA